MAILINELLNIYIFIIIIRAVLSWLNVSQYNRMAYLIYRLTEPVLEPIRNLLKPYAAGIDFSPVVAFFLIYLLKRLVFFLFL
jgi:YggT family protein